MQKERWYFYSCKVLCKLCKNCMYKNTLADAKKQKQQQQNTTQHNTTQHRNNNKFCLTRER